jgi:hypothetical protein
MRSSGNQDVSSDQSAFAARPVAGIAASNRLDIASSVTGSSVAGL